MSGNLFTDVYRVKEEMFHGASWQEELHTLRQQVEEDIARGSTPDKLHYLMFKMTNRCNSNCEYCAHATGRAHLETKADISKELILKTIRQAAELGVTAISVNGGEPLVRSDIFEIIEEIIGRGIVPVLMTNGLLLPQMWEQLGDLGVKYVIISFDSLNEAVYEKQRGASFQKAMEGIEAAVKMQEKYGAEIHVSAVLTRDNQDDFVDLIRFMTQRGIKIHVSPFHNYLAMKDEISIVERDKIVALVDQLLEMKANGYLIASSTGFIRHLVDFFCLGHNVPTEYRCKIGYTNLFVDAYGNVRPCWSGQFAPIGVLGETSLAEMWHGSMMDYYRDRMLHCGCEGCWYMCTGEVTLLLDDILD